MINIVQYRKALKQIERDSIVLSGMGFARVKHETDFVCPEDVVYVYERYYKTKKIIKLPG